MIEDKIKHPSKTDFCLKQFQFPCNVSQFVQGEETGGDNDIGDISIGHHGVICHQHQKLVTNTFGFKHPSSASCNWSLVNVQTPGSRRFRVPYFWRKYHIFAWNIWFRYYFCRIFGQNLDSKSILPSVKNQYMNKHEEILDLFHSSLRIVRIY